MRTLPLTAINLHDKVSKKTLLSDCEAHVASRTERDIDSYQEVRYFSCYLSLADEAPTLKVLDLIQISSLNGHHHQLELDQVHTKWNWTRSSGSTPGAFACRSGPAKLPVPVPRCSASGSCEQSFRRASTSPLGGPMSLKPDTWYAGEMIDPLLDFKRQEWVYLRRAKALDPLYVGPVFILFRQDGSYSVRICESLGLNTVLRLYPSNPLPQPAPPLRQKAIEDAYQTYLDNHPIAKRLPIEQRRRQRELLCLTQMEHA